MNKTKRTKKGLALRIAFFALWFLFLVFLMDGLGLFPHLTAIFGYTVTEVILWALVLVPLLSVVRYTWRYYHERKDDDKQAS